MSRRSSPPPRGRRAGQQVTRGIHAHTCVGKDCRRRYQCVNDCDPKHLRDSLCAPCFKAAQEA